MTLRRHPSSGFTLIELMIIVGIFGVLVAISVPTMRGFLRSSRLRGAQDTLMGDIRRARSLATAHRRTHQILCNGSAYTIYQCNPADTLLKRPLPRGVTISSTDTMTFFSWGLTRPVAVILRDAVVRDTLQVRASGVVE